MGRKLGELGCTGVEARERLKRLLNMGLKDIALDDPSMPVRSKDRTFIKDMIEVLANNPDFEPSYGQIVYAQDLYDKFIL